MFMAVCVSYFVNSLICILWLIFFRFIVLIISKSFWYILSCSQSLVLFALVILFSQALDATYM